MTQEGGQQQALDQLAQGLVRDYWEFYPTAGSRIGRHEYDGKLPDLSQGKIASRVRSLNDALSRLAGINPDALDSERRLSHRLTEMFLRREVFTLTEMRSLENNPMRQLGFLNVGSYVLRDYAPLSDRLRSATEVLRQVPDFLNTLDAALTQQVGEPVLDMSIEAYAGMARFYRMDLTQPASGVGDAAIKGEFDAAREVAAGALDRFVQGLESRKRQASPEFGIGARLYSSMMSHGELVDVTLEHLEKVGQANLEDNLSRLAEVAGKISPSRTVPDIVAEISRNHPDADALIPDTEEMLEELRQAVLDLDVLSVPSQDRCQVVETPSYMRYAFAAMDSAGALEEKATESFYYVTPVETHWSPTQQEEWLSNFNYDTLRIISIHEVYPGHFVHHLHSKYGRELPLVNRVASSYAFVEGWAHYTEQMFLDAGYDQGGLNLQLTQLLEALVRNCRYICSIRMHTKGMSVDEATRFFMENAHMGEHPARREALRGTFDPGYLNYTLGKLMIIKLAQDLQKEKGDAFTLKGFHDELLSYGAPPIPLMREVMLENPGDSPL